MLTMDGEKRSVLARALVNYIEKDVRAYLANENDSIPLEIPNDVVEKMSRREKVVEEGETFYAMLQRTDFPDLQKIIDKNINILSIGSEKSRLCSQLLRSCFAARNTVSHSRDPNDEDLDNLKAMALFLANAEEINAPLCTKVIEQIKSDPDLSQIPSFKLHNLSPTIHNNIPSPEYADTGLLGRTKELSALRNMILKDNIPVITIIAEGGYGKTALARQTAYNLLNDIENPFEIILWLTLKTRALSGLNVEDLNSAISSMKGVYAEISRTLLFLENDNDDNHHLKEIAAWTSTFRTLLVIDNLETIDSDEIQSLVSAVGPGSKILITSRMSMRYREEPFRLKELPKSAAGDLLIKFSKIMNVQELINISPESIERLTERLFYSPLLIRWFVIGVKNGNDPEALLSPSSEGYKQAISFCFENLYSRLDENCKNIIHILFAVKMPLSWPAVRFIAGDAGMSADAINYAESELKFTSLLQINDSKDPNNLSKQYQLNDIVSEYIRHNNSVSPEFADRAYRSLRKYSEQRKKFESSVKKSKVRYSSDSIRPRNSDEYLLTPLLVDALELHRNGHQHQAQEMIERVLSENSKFVSALTLAGYIFKRIDPDRAEDYLKSAVNYNKKDAFPLYCYAKFLVKHETHQNTEAAVQYLEKARRLDTDSEDLDMAYAFALKLNGEFERSEVEYKKILEKYNSGRRNIKITDGIADLYIRMSQVDYHQDEEEKARKITLLLKSLQTTLPALQERHDDQKLNATFIKAISEIVVLGRKENDTALIRKIASLCLDNAEYLDSAIFRLVRRDMGKTVFFHLANSLETEQRTAFMTHFTRPRPETPA